MALSSTCREAEWLRDLLLDIDLWPRPMPPITIYCDSEATMSRALNKVYNGKSRHISLRHAFIKEMLANDVVSILFVRTHKNLADPLTKPLSRELVNVTTFGMGLKPLN